MALIEARHLVKQFVVWTKGRGVRGALLGLVRPRYRRVLAVDNVSFAIEPAEIVGYLGPNGAGKSTTVKMLCGILHPTAGEVRVAGASPQRDRIAVVRKLGVIFGQRSQLYWDLRLGESLELMRRIYDVGAEEFHRNLALVSDLLELGPLLDVPVRQLSLGERMRGDFAAALLHSPPILVLDEPTIGLDIAAKQAVRRFVLDLNQRFGTTVILSTHDLGDVEQLCRRVILIDRGRIVEDAPLPALVEKLAPHRLLVVDFEAPPREIVAHPAVEVVRRDGVRAELRFDRNRISAAELIALVSRHHAVRDLSIREPRIEDVVGRFYGRRGSGA